VRKRHYLDLTELPVRQLSDFLGESCDRLNVDARAVR
jgi:hypothetical protein